MAEPSGFSREQGLSSRAYSPAGFG
jgi:hypothetical protein